VTPLLVTVSGLSPRTYLFVHARWLPTTLSAKKNRLMVRHDCVTVPCRAARLDGGVFSRIWRRVRVLAT